MIFAKEDVEQKYVIAYPPIDLCKSENERQKLDLKSSNKLFQLNNLITCSTFKAYHLYQNLTLPSPLII